MTGSILAGLALDTTVASTNSKLDALNALYAALATGAKQDTGNTSLASIDTKLSSVATAAKQDTGNTSLGSLDTKLPAKGQALMAVSTPVTIASDQSAIPVSIADLSVTGQSAQTAVINNILTAVAGANATDCSTFRSATVQVVSTGTAGTYIFEGSNDNTNWVAIPVFNMAVITATAITAAVTATASNTVYNVPISFRYLRLRIATTITGGSIQAFSRFSDESYTAAVTLVAQPTGANLATSVTQIPTAAALTDSFANPTEGHLASEQMQFNGTAWDRSRNNVNATTGDTGAKTATFNGATQINYNARGALITCLFGTVTGTAPTIAIQLQWSPDGGTTWLNWGPGIAAFTPVSGNTAVLVVYPTQLSDDSTVTLASFTTNASQAKAMNAILPRTWRLAYTITGTTPSITITAVYVNYQL